MPNPEIAQDDPRAADVMKVLAQHLAFVNTQTPREAIHALDVDGLRDPAITFFSLRCDGAVLAVAALRELDSGHVELKSMHTTQPARGKGLARALLEELLAIARARGFRRISLETGTAPGFAAAQALYVSAGFVPCAPFGDYLPTEHNRFMTLSLA